MESGHPSKICMPGKRNKLRRRLYFASIAIGCAVSLLILGISATGIGLWFPPFWPGPWFSWLVVIICHGEAWGDWVTFSLLVTGNALFYSCVSYRVVRADVLARGRFGPLLVSIVGKIAIYAHSEIFSLRA